MLNAAHNPESALRELVDMVLEADDPDGEASLPKGLVCRLILQAIHSSRALSDRAVIQHSQHALDLAILDLEREAYPISRC